MELRPQLGKGLVVFTCFLLMIIANDILFPDPLILSEYWPVSADRLLQNSQDFEGVKVSFGVVVSEITDNITEFTYLASTEEGVNLLIPKSLGMLDVGDDILLRGISYLHSAGYIEVIEIYVTDSIGPILKSIPGIISLIILFFLIFTFDFQKLAFVPRSDQNA